ncbi:hypothetical protein COX85_02150 [Candidatus Micrarchaeota archaeon CG_4_10_14_0_2_um_filter_55_9]|nr:MAG: hypothetical protein AUJ15_03610 [Candidatus Micrarchaeota archaeon CG1_02_55_41]PIZ91763.1 MAG: hypothetical protein COX85_02150 [Candidatus Micrarchaeota archaeon CG_4_10_14_0_2_um_filter_55_9]PJD01454.1 MAG: hypothetical protein COU38_00760 [Candidatus Micrarchaeota archaeon CG10_big_fil_rev_8_21_14_0_10_54_18]
MNWWEDYGIELPGDCMVFGTKKARVATRQVVELAKKIGGQFEVVGLAAAKKNAEWKPSTDFLRTFPPAKRVVNVSREEAEKFVRGRDLEKKAGRGFVAVKTNGIVVGCGFARGKAIESKVPKSSCLKQGI